MKVYVRGDDNFDNIFIIWGQTLNDDRCGFPS